MKEELNRTVNIIQRLTNKIVDINEKANQFLTEEEFELLNNKLTELLNKYNTKRKLYVLSEEEMSSLQVYYASSYQPYLTYDQQSYYYNYIRYQDGSVSQNLYFYNIKDLDSHIQYIEIETTSDIYITCNFRADAIKQLEVLITDQNLNILYRLCRYCYRDDNIEVIPLPSIPTTTNYKIWFSGYPVFQLEGQLMKISGFTDEYQMCNGVYRMYIHYDTYNLLISPDTDNFCALYKQQSGIWKLVLLPAEKMYELQVDYYGESADIINFASQCDGIELPNFSFTDEDAQLYFDVSTIEKQKFFACIEGTYTYTQKDTNITHTITIQPYTVLDFYNQYYKNN